MRKALNWRLAPIIILTIFCTRSFSQCTVNSSNGYSVTIRVLPTAIVAPGGCPWGYNYNVTLSYNISFSGSNIPGSLHTLQGMVNCKTAPATRTNLFFDLPNNGGVGSVTTGSNPYVAVTGGMNTYAGVPSCQTATVNTLDCLAQNLAIDIDGPGIAPQTVSCTIALPVKLVRFESRKTGEAITLEWTTSMEKNFSHFVLERADESLEFKEIGTVPGRGAEQVRTDYSYTDPFPPTGKVYYRLKSIDIDETFDYSKLIHFATFSNLKATVYPTVIDKQFTVAFNTDSDDLTSIALIDLFGKVAMKKQIATRTTQVTLDNSVPSGLYYLKIESMQNSSTVRVAVQ